MEITAADMKKFLEMMQKLREDRNYTKIIVESTAHESKPFDLKVKRVKIEKNIVFGEES